MITPRDNNRNVVAFCVLRLFSIEASDDDLIISIYAILNGGHPITNRSAYSEWSKVQGHTYAT